MIPRSLRRQIAAALEGYAWLWRAAHTHATSPITGTMRFLACAIQDLLLLGVWCFTTPFTRPCLRNRVAVPALGLLVVMLLSPAAPDRSGSGPMSVASVPEHVGSACGGALTLGAIANPGDELLAFEACADAFASLPGLCEACELEPSVRGLRLPDHQRLELSI